MRSCQGAGSIVGVICGMGYSKHMCEHQVVCNSSLCWCVDECPAMNTLFGL